MSEHPVTRVDAPVRVLIVDDDPTYRLVLTKAFEKIKGVELVGSAGTLALARTKIERGMVDVVTIDVVLKDESGLELLPWIQAHHPHLITVLVTSGLAQQARLAVDAMLLGASTLILKPKGPNAPTELSDALTRVVAEAQRRPPLPGRPAKALTAPVRGQTLATAAIREVIAVGASTGGPPVVLQFLKSLPASFDVPILLTQHMPALHVPYFAELLERESKRAVQLAVHGTTIEPGGVYVACDAKHMRLVRSAGRLMVEQDDGPEEHHCRPAVDPMFRSVAAICGDAAVGVVMTGMGSDGALGALALRAVGAPVIAQDRETSVVWGMPGAVAAAGAANALVPALQLAAAVTRWTAERTRR